MRTRSQLLNQLAETKRQIEHGDDVIKAQRRILISISNRGHDPFQAEQLLASFEQSREIWHREMDRLLNMLDGMDRNAA